MEIIIIISLIVYFFHDSIFDFIEWILDVFCDMLDFFAEVKIALEKFWNWLLNTYEKITNKNKEKVYFEPVKVKTNKEPIKEEQSTVAKQPATQIKQDNTISKEASLDLYHEIKDKVSDTAVKEAKQKKAAEIKQISYHLTITNKKAFVTKEKDQFNVSALTSIFSSYSLRKVVARTPQGKNISLRGEIPALEFVNTEENNFDIIIEGKHCYIAMNAFIEALYANNCIDVNTYQDIMKRFKTITVTYQYNDKDKYVFVDEINNNEYRLNEDQIQLNVYSLKENEKYDLFFVDGEVEILTFYTEKKHHSPENKQISCHLTIINRDAFLTKGRSRSDVLKLTNIFDRFSLTKAVAITPNGKNISLKSEISAYEFVNTEENDFEIVIEGKDCFVAMNYFISTLYNNKCIYINQYNKVVNRFKLRTVIYQYSNHDHYTFMDKSDYTSYTLTEDQIFMNTSALKENELYDLLFVDEKPETLLWYNEANHETKETGLSYQLTIRNQNRLISESIRGIHADGLPVMLSKYKLKKAFVKTINEDVYSLGREIDIFSFSIHGEDEYTIHIEGENQALAMKEVLDLFYHLDMIDPDQYDRIMEHFMIKTVTYHPALSNQNYIFSDEENYYPLTDDQIYLDVNKLNENEVYDLLFIDNNLSMLCEHDDYCESMMSKEEIIAYNKCREDISDEEIEETLGPVLLKDVSLFNKHIDAIARNISQLYEYEVELFYNEKLYNMKSAESLKEADIQKTGMYFIAVQGNKNTFNVLTFVCDLLNKADIATYAVFRFERKRTTGTLPMDDCLTYTKLSEAKYIIFKQQPYEINKLRYCAYLDNDVPEGEIIANARKLNKTSFESLGLPLSLNDVMIVTDLSEKEMMEKYPCIDEETVKEEINKYPSDMKVIIDDSCFGCFGCVEVCPEGAIGIDLFAYVNQEKCTRCGKCINECPISAISFNENYKETKN